LNTRTITENTDHTITASATSKNIVFSCTEGSHMTILYFVHLIIQNIQPL